MTLPFTRRAVPFPAIPAFGDTNPAHASDAPFTAEIGLNIGTVVGTGAVDPTLLRKAVDMGARLVRFGPRWDQVEEYTGSGVYDWPNGVTSTLAWFRDNAPDVRVMLVAAYGPPWQSQGTLTVTAAGNVGDFTVQVSGPAGVLAGFTFPRDLVIISGSGAGRQLGNRHGYGGTLIDSVTPTSITLASALVQPLPIGTSLTVNRLKWEPISTDTQDPASSNVQGYIAYVRALAALGASYGLAGWVELQNEPPWSDEPWPVGRNRYYDNGPDINAVDPDPGMLPILRAALSVKGLPDRWRLCSGATHKSNGKNVLSANWTATTGGDVVTDDQLRDAVTAQARHPYSAVSPVSALWDPGTLQTAGGGNPRFEQLDPNSVSNFNRAPYQQQIYRNAGRPAPMLIASEWGYSIAPDGAANDALQAKYLVAGTLARWGCNVLPMPYTLQTTGNYTLLLADGTPRLGYSALQRLMTAVQALGSGTSGAGLLPGLQAWRFDDTTRLHTVGVYGGDAACVFLWQEPIRSNYAATPAVTARPAELWCPPQGTASALRVSDGVPVTLTQVGRTVTVLVTDDPVMVTVTAA